MSLTILLILLRISFIEHWKQKRETSLLTTTTTTTTFIVRHLLRAKFQTNNLPYCTSQRAIEYNLWQKQQQQQQHEAATKKQLTLDLISSNWIKWINAIWRRRAREAKESFIALCEFCQLLEAEIHFKRVALVFLLSQWIRSTGRK